MSNAYTATIFC